MNDNSGRHSFNALVRKVAADGGLYRGVSEWKASCVTFTNGARDVDASLVSCQGILCIYAREMVWLGSRQLDVLLVSFSDSVRRMF